MRAAREILSISQINESRKPSSINPQEAQLLLESFKEVKLLSPPTDCLSPIEDLLIKKGLSKICIDSYSCTICSKWQPISSRSWINFWN